MNLQDIRDLYDYNDWANRLLLDQAGRLSREQLNAATPHSFGSLFATFKHILDTERGWRGLLMGEGFLPDIEADEVPTLDALRERWAQEEAHLRAYLAGLSEADLPGVVTYPGDAGVMRRRRLWHCLFHVVNHGMQHRSEAANILTTFGQSPGDIDFTVFLNHHLPDPRS